MSDGIRALASKLKQRYDATITTGTVTGIKGLEDRSLVEVELANGSLSNAFYWGQGDIQVGDDVVLGHPENNKHGIYTILNANSTPAGLDPLDRDPAPDVDLWSGATFRPDRVPKSNGGVRIITQAKALARLHFQTYTKLKVDLVFSIPPNNAHLRYWLYGYDADNPTFTGDPGFALRIGSSWISGDNRRHRTIFDMDAPGLKGDWLDDRDEAYFVLVMERISAGTVRAVSTGRIRALTLSFVDDVLADPIVLSASASMDTFPTTDEVNIHMSVSAKLDLHLVWCDATAAMDVRPVIRGAI